MTETPDLDAMRLEGRRSTGVWGAAAGAGVLAIVLAYFLYAHLYLSVSAEEWPPRSVEDPPLLAPTALLGLIAVSAAVALWTARHRPHDDVQAGVALGLAAVAGLGIVFLVAGAMLVADLGLEPTEQAYSAITTTVHAVQGAATLTGVVIASLSAFEAHRIGPHPWVSAATVVTAIWSCTIVVGWIAVFGVVYVWPQLS